MHQSDFRRWVTAIAFFAVVLQALLSPATSAPPSVDLAQQLLATTGTVAPDQSAQLDIAALDASGPAPATPARNAPIPFCPYFACSFDLAHATGLTPAVDVGPTLALRVDAPQSIVASTAPEPSAAKAHRVRGPPASV